MLSYFLVSVKTNHCMHEGKLNTTDKTYARMLLFICVLCFIIILYAFLLFAWKNEEIYAMIFSIVNQGVRGWRGRQTTDRDTEQPTSRQIKQQAKRQTDRQTDHSSITQTCFWDLAKNPLPTSISCFHCFPSFWFIADPVLV